MSELINQGLRPCIFGENKERGLFHCWTQIATSKISTPRGIVEDEQGYTHIVSVGEIRFLDNEN